jgi:hypothetical protein
MSGASATPDLLREAVGGAPYPGEGSRELVPNQHWIDLPGAAGATGTTSRPAGSVVSRR